MIDLSFEAVKASGAVPQWFGLGFVQIKLNYKHRMHFWHPDYSRNTSDEEVHNHRYSYTSRIIVGDLIHETWAYTECSDGDTECIEVSCKPGNNADPIPQSNGTMVINGRYNMLTGSSYYFPATGFHRIIAKKAVTLLCRGEIESENAKVLRPIGTPFICPFSVQKSDNECWDIIHDLLKNIGNVSAK